MVCKCGINPNDRTTHKHHDWTIHPKRDANNKVIEGNYVGALCMNCNIKISEKKRTLPCFAHNGSKFDLKLLLQGPNKNKHVK